MIVDLQKTEAPCAGVSGCGKSLGVFNINLLHLHRVTLGDQSVVLLIGQGNLLFAVFAARYSEALSNFIDACSFRFDSYGSDELERLFEVGYCRVRFCEGFVQSLVKNVNLCLKIKAVLDKFGVGQKL